MNAGTVVRLRSGGPLMTVDNVQEKNVYCVWFLFEQYHEGVFRPESLDVIPAKETE
jgi:uncharacterized protein YodC (DUF2158 family)